jgi:Holliday junction resolvase RusA-like endonuclease
MRTFTIPGEPVAKARPKVTRAGIAFTPKKTVNYETLVKQLYWEKHHGQIPMAGPLEMKVRAYFQIPKNVSKKKRLAMIAGLDRPLKRPDGDNIMKIIADSLNGIAYHDDSHIVTATVEKHWGEIPRVEVEILEAEVFSMSG